jgi:hypothetical protein
MNQYSLYGKVPFVFADPIEKEDFEIEKVIKKIDRKVPEHLFYSIDGIYVGHLPEFEERKINALYSDGAIYVTNRQKDEMDMTDDIVHELAHASEKDFNDVIYGDGSMEREFLLKRKNLFKRLEEDGIPVNLNNFLETDFDLKFDFFLLKDIGYNVLKKYIDGLFNSCYSVTSLSEYYASGFTDYFLYDRDSVRNLCPVVYNKILKIIDPEEENDAY